MDAQFSSTRANVEDSPLFTLGHVRDHSSTKSKNRKDVGVEYDFGIFDGPIYQRTWRRHSSIIYQYIYTSFFHDFRHHGIDVLVICDIEDEFPHIRVLEVIHRR